MAKQRTLQLLRGTTAQNDAFTGAAGEVTVDTDVNGLRVHDGSTAGGHAIYTKQQTDTLLSAKANDNAVVHLAGSETITGSKTFNSAIRLKDNLTPSTTATKATTIEDNLIAVSQNTNGQDDGAAVVRRQKTNGDREVMYRAGFRNAGDTANLWPDVRVGVTPNDQKYVDLSSNDRSYACPISDNTDESSRIATTQWVKNNRSIWTTNCITEIPQDIKLTLSNGTLTLKAGSKVYVPNGSGVFNVVNIANDLTRTDTSNGGMTLYVNATGTSLVRYSTGSEDSGTTEPTGNNTFYNTSTNTINRYNSGVKDTNPLSFPICHYTVSGGQITSIDQVFNGFGYIGSTVFALPGVKGLIPNGRNADGTLKNTSFTLSSVITRTFSVAYSGDYDVFLDGSAFGALKNAYSYDEANNRNKDGSSDYNSAYIGTMHVTWGVVNQFNTKIIFHAVDYSDWNEHRVVAFQAPTIANGYRWYRKYADGWVEQGGPLTTGATETITYDIPLKYAVCPTVNGSTTRQVASYDDETHARSYSTTGFTTRHFFPQGGNGGSWEVKGMAA